MRNYLYLSSALYGSFNVLLLLFVVGQTEYHPRHPDTRRYSCSYWVGRWVSSAWEFPAYFPVIAVSQISHVLWTAALLQPFAWRLGPSVSRIEPTRL